MLFSDVEENENPPPTELLVGIAGFGETERRDEDAGIDYILWDAFSNKPGIMVGRYNWNHNTYAIFKLIQRTLYRWPQINVNVLGYSYGGTSAVSLCDKLRTALPKAITVKNLFLVDPVWRPRHYLPSFMSILGNGTLAVPRNVLECYVWRQSQSIIRGCTVVAPLSKKTEASLPYTHSKIDEALIIKETIVDKLCHS